MSNAELSTAQVGSTIVALEHLETAGVSFFRRGCPVVVAQSRNAINGRTRGEAAEFANRERFASFPASIVTRNVEFAACVAIFFSSIFRSCRFSLRWD